MENKQTKILGITEESEFGEIRAIVDGAADINCLATLTPSVDLVEKAASYPVDALVLYTKYLTAEEEEFINAYFAVRKGVAGILVTEAEKNVELMEKAMELGFSKVLRASYDLESIRTAIVRETQRQNAREDTAEVQKYDSRVIAVYSAKGGAGKTTTTTNLATTLSIKGKKVAVIDLDLSFGDLASTFDIADTDTIAELAEERSLTPSLIKKYLVKSAAGPQVLCAPSSPELVDLITPDLITKIIETLRIDNDFVLIDCYQQLDECTGRALRDADEVLLIVNPEVPTIKSTKSAKKKYFVTYKLYDKTKLVINKDGSSSVTAEEIAETLEMPVFASIPYDHQSIVQSTNIGTPYMYTAMQTKSLLKRKLKTAYENLTQKILESK